MRVTLNSWQPMIHYQKLGLSAYDLTNTCSSHFVNFETNILPTTQYKYLKPLRASFRPLQR